MHPPCPQGVRVEPVVRNPFTGNWSNHHPTEDASAKPFGWVIGERVETNAADALIATAPGFPTTILERHAADGPAS